MFVQNTVHDDTVASSTSTVCVLAQHPHSRRTENLIRDKVVNELQSTQAFYE